MMHRPFGKEKGSVTIYERIVSVFISGESLPWILETSWKSLKSFVEKEEFHESKFKQISWTLFNLCQQLRLSSFILFLNVYFVS